MQKLSTTALDSLNFTELKAKLQQNQFRMCLASVHRFQMLFNVKLTPIISLGLTFAMMYFPMKSILLWQR